MKPDQANLAALLATTLATKPEEIDCDRWLEHVAHYAELVQRGEHVPDDLALVEQHVTVCPECREELDALLTILSDSS